MFGRRLPVSDLRKPNNYTKPLQHFYQRASAIRAAEENKVTGRLDEIVPYLRIYLMSSHAMPEENSNRNGLVRVHRGNAQGLTAMCCAAQVQHIRVDIAIEGLQPLLRDDLTMAER